MKKCRNSNSN